MSSSHQFLTAYDEQLRTEAETPGAITVERLGPLRLATFAGGRGFVTYRDLDGASWQTIAGWVVEALAAFREDPATVRVEWKTRGHDHAPGLHDTLIRNGFEPDETESIMIGKASALAVDVQLPPGVRLRQVTKEQDIRPTAGGAESRTVAAVALQYIAVGRWGFGWFKWLRPRRCRGLRLNVCPAVTYSPTPSRVQYHRRCGS